jgi:hypothetical protein
MLTFDATGKPLLSWRVHHLPLLDQNWLYSQFHLNEPWDSPNNLALLSRMPDVYRSAGDPWDSSTTRVQGFTGTGAPFPATGTNSTVGLSDRNIGDGFSNTILAAESGNPVPWAKPTDMPFDLNNPLSPLGDVGPNFVTAFLDGHVTTQLASISPDLLKAYITYNGGESVTSPPPINTVPAIFIAQSAGDTKLNEFGVDAFDVVLEKAPQSNVVISLASGDTNIATVDKPTLTFTPANWNLPQRVAVRGVDNHAINPDQLVNITVAVIAALSDDQYDPVAPKTFTATVLNDDFATADYNHSGLVDQADYDSWRANFGGNANAALAADGNLSGTVDASDYVLWRKNATAPAIVTGIELARLTATSIASDADLRSSPPAQQLTTPVDSAFAQLLGETPTTRIFEEQSRQIINGAFPAESSGATLNVELLLADPRPAFEPGTTPFDASVPTIDPSQADAIDLALGSVFNDPWRTFE